MYIHICCKLALGWLVILSWMPILESTEGVFLIRKNHYYTHATHAHTHRSEESTASHHTYIYIPTTPHRLRLACHIVASCAMLRFIIISSVTAHRRRRHYWLILIKRELKLSARDLWTVCDCVRHFWSLSTFRAQIREKKERIARTTLFLLLCSLI